MNLAFWSSYNASMNWKINIYKLIQHFYIYLIFDPLIRHMVWLYFYYQRLKESTKTTELSQPSSFKRDLTEIKYVLLMASLFHILFNNLPSIFIQSIYISSLSSTSFFATMDTIHFLAVIKIAHSIFRICITSASFLKHFLVHEFAINDFKFQEWKFMLCRTMANICLLAARTTPIIVLANFSRPTCIAFTVFVYLRQLVHELVVIYSECDKQHSCLTIFWCFVLSSIKTSVLFAETDVLDFVKKRLKSGLVLVNHFFICIETGVLFGLIYMFGMTHFWQLVFITSVFYVSAFGVDLFYWNIIYAKSPGIRKKFQNWIYSENLKIQSNQYLENETQDFLISTP